MSRLALAEWLVGEARKAGADQAEAFLEDATMNVVGVEEGKVSELTGSTSQGVGIRVWVGGREGFTYTSDLRQESLRRQLELVLAAARMTEPVPGAGLPDGSGDMLDLGWVDPEIRGLSQERRVELASQLEREVLSAHPLVNKVMRLRYQDAIRKVYLVNSNGRRASSERGTCGIFAGAIAEKDGEQTIAYYGTGAQRLSSIDIHAIGHEAARLAAATLGGKQVPSQKAVVVFHPQPISTLLGMVANALSGDAVEKKRSFFAGKIGEKVAADGFHLIDDPMLEDGTSSAPFDGEGVPTSRKHIIENGVLTGYFYDAKTGRKAGMGSTGNGFRSGYRSTPSPHGSNLYLAPGDVTAEDLIADVEEGFYVTSVSPNGGFNPVTGSLSVGAAGMWIRNGRFVSPVRGVTVASPVIEMFKNIHRRANDVRYGYGAGAPTVVVDEMTIAGS